MRPEAYIAAATLLCIFVPKQRLWPDIRIFEGFRINLVDRIPAHCRRNEQSYTFAQSA